MPNRLKRFCRKQGCNQLVESGFCDKHKAESYQRYDRYRGTAAERGYGSRWQKASRGFLKENPLCLKCEKHGLIVAAKVTDHIIPHKGDMDLFWDRANWQPLCKQCHDRKTAKEDGGFGR